jgi:hypothetical protein
MGLYTTSGRNTAGLNKPAIHAPGINGQEGQVMPKHGVVSITKEYYSSHDMTQSK